METRDEVHWKRKATELRERADRLHRSVLDKDVLQRTLPLRARTAASRSARPEVRERERLFREVSPAYVGQLDDTSSDGRLYRLTVDGLTWWVPLAGPAAPDLVDSAIAHQDFPYRAITQTREVAIGGAMIDVGANVGRMSIPRVILGDVDLAYCAEPDPLNYACLARNVRDNNLAGLVLPDRVAVGSETGMVRFERGKSAGGHRVVDAGHVGRRETITVPMVTLDAWCDRVGIDLDRAVFVKVDVQGLEARVLTGAARVLARRHIAWQIEVDPYCLERAGAGVAELVALLQRHFTHFIDLSRHGTGERVRPVVELPDALAYVCEAEGGRTDVLAFTLA